MELPANIKPEAAQQLKVQMVVQQRAEPCACTALARRAICSCSSKVDLGPILPAAARSARPEAFRPDISVLRKAEGYATQGLWPVQMNPLISFFTAVKLPRRSCVAAEAGCVAACCCLG